MLGSFCFVSLQHHVPCIIVRPAPAMLTAAMQCQVGAGWTLEPCLHWCLAANAFNCLFLNSLENRNSRKRSGLGARTDGGSATPAHSQTTSCCQQQGTCDGVCRMLATYRHTASRPQPDSTSSADLAQAHTHTYRSMVSTRSYRRCRCRLLPLSHSAPPHTPGHTPARSHT